MSTTSTARDLRPGMTVKLVGLSEQTLGQVNGETHTLLCGAFKKDSPTVTIASIDVVDRYQVGCTGFGTYRVETTDGRVFAMSNRQRAELVNQ